MTLSLFDLLTPVCRPSTRGSPKLKPGQTIVSGSSQVGFGRAGFRVEYRGILQLLLSPFSFPVFSLFKTFESPIYYYDNVYIQL